MVSKWEIRCLRMVMTRKMSLVVPFGVDWYYPKRTGRFFGKGKATAGSDLKT
jgi:hypothetical protein